MYVEMAEVLTGWQPDPFGAHEKRFFSTGGLPTKLVSDGDVRSYDDPSPVSGPPAEPVDRPPPTTVIPTRPIETQPAIPPRNGTAETAPVMAPAPVAAPTPVADQRKQGTTRLAFLCRNCGHRHNASDGLCPRCGEPSLTSDSPAPSVALREPQLAAPPLIAPPATVPPAAAPRPTAPPLIAHQPAGPAPSAPRPIAPPLTVPGPLSDPGPDLVTTYSVNGFAVASLVLGLVWVPLAGPILAIVFGVVAKRQIKTAPGGQGGNAMASWGIALGCLGIVASIIVSLVLLNGSPGPSPNSGALTTVTTARVATVDDIVAGDNDKAAFVAASGPLDAANVALTKALASSSGGPVAKVAQAVTPYVTALTTFDYKLGKISWLPSVRLQSENLTIRVRSLITFLSTISSATTATVNSWVAQLRSLASSTQSADNLVRTEIALSNTDTFP